MRTYLEWACREALEMGILPHSNVGIVDTETLRSLQSVNASMGLMLESTSPLAAHRRSPSKTPERRLQFIAEAGRLRIPFTTGLLIGIGETLDDRVQGLRAISELAFLYRHIQEVILQPIVPSSRFPVSPPTKETMIDVISVARRLLPRDVAIQVPANLVEPDILVELLAAGASDLGGVSPITCDAVNPTAPWPEISSLGDYLAIHGIGLQPRLPIYPPYVSRAWCSDGVLAVARAIPCERTCS